MLIKKSWSVQLIDGLEAIREEGDIWVDKYRASGFFGTELEQLLSVQGLQTLFFAGVNTDQCVMGTLQDASALGYDCVLLTDCTATTSPQGAGTKQYYIMSNALVFSQTPYGFAKEKQLMNTSPSCLKTTVK